MKLFVILSVLFSSFFSNSQTKLIAHKSHSGSNETFAIAFENNLFDTENSNFGIQEMEIKDYNKIDSVVYLSENKVIVFSSEYTQRFYRRNSQKCSADELIQIKKDTFYIKPVSKKIGLTALDVRTKLDSLKIYSNNLSETVYKGFERNNKLQKKKKKSVLPLIIKFPIIPTSFFLIGIVGVLSFLVYIISYRLNFVK